MNMTLSLLVAFDEDFEGELADNNDARLEVSLLARSPDSELTEVSNSTFKSDDCRYIFCIYYLIMLLII